MDIRQLTRRTRKFALYSFWAITLLALLILLGSVGVPYLGPLVLNWIIEPLATIGIAISTTLLAYVSATTTFVAFIAISRIAKALSRAKKYKQNKGIDISKAVKTLFQAKLFSLKNLKKLLKHESSQSLNVAVRLLHNKELRTQENFNVINTRREPLKLARALRALNDAGLGTTKNRQVLINSLTPNKLTDILNGLTTAKLNNQKNFDMVRKHSKHEGALEAIIALSAADHPFNLDIRLDLIRKHKNPGRLAEGIKLLLLNIELRKATYYEAVCQHNTPRGLALAISALYKTELLVPENLQVLIKHDNPVELEHIITPLHNKDIKRQQDLDMRASFLSDATVMPAESKLFTQATFEAICKHKNQRGLAKAINALSSAGDDSLILMDKYNFKILMEHDDLEGLANAVDIYSSRNYIYQESFRFLASIKNQANLPDVARAHIKLSDSILWDKYKNEISKSENPIHIAIALLKLRMTNTIDPLFDDLVVKAKYPQSIADLLYELKCAKIPIIPYIDDIAKHNAPERLFEPLATLRRAKLASQDNFKVLLKHQDETRLNEAAIALIILYDHELLEQYRKTIADSKQPLDSATLLCQLKKTELMTAPNIKLALKHENHSELESALSVMRDENLCSEKNFNLVAKQAKPHGIKPALIWLKQRGQELHENIVEQILPISYLFLDDEAQRRLNKLPEKLFSSDVLEKIITIGTQAKGDVEKAKKEIEYYFDVLIHVDDLRSGNNKQGIFFSIRKVHEEEQEVQENEVGKQIFSDLDYLYWQRISESQLGNTLNQILEWVIKQPTNDRNQIAIAALYLLSKEPVSSLDKHMALVWHGIHTGYTLKKGITKEHALESIFIEGLQNIQDSKPVKSDGKLRANLNSSINEKISTIFDVAVRSSNGAIRIK